MPSLKQVKKGVTTAASKTWAVIASILIALGLGLAGKLALWVASWGFLGWFGPLLLIVGCAIMAVKKIDDSHDAPLGGLTAITAACILVAVIEVVVCVGLLIAPLAPLTSFIASWGYWLGVGAVAFFGWKVRTAGRFTELK